MILKKLTIEQFGKIEHFDILFNEQVTAITVHDTESIVKAIGLATGNKYLIGPFRGIYGFRQYTNCPQS